MKPTTMSLVLTLFSSAATPSFAQPVQFFESMATFPAKDGISPRDYDKFWDKWKQVTVRYRKDNGEQRFMYANNIAWDALNKKQKKFPNGAVFTKVAFATTPDPAFPSSLVPSTSTRIQIMVKDDKKYAKNDGWGYAVYTPQKSKSFQPGEDTQEAEACHACHKLVPDRDFVFSLDMFAANDMKKINPLFKQKFASANVEKTSNSYAKKIFDALIPSHKGPAASYGMTLFSGSISESLTPLADFALEDKRPFLLYDEAKKEFLMTVPANPAPQNCKNPVRFYQSGSADKTKSLSPSFADQSKLVFVGVLCDGVSQPETVQAAPTIF